MTVSYCFLILAVSFTALSQIMYKLYFKKDQNSACLMVTVLMFCIVPICNYKALQTLPIDTVYMATSLTMVLVLAGSTTVLKEKMNRNQVMGSCLIILGVFLYNF